MWIARVLFCAAGLLIGCDADRVSKLEKDNADLRARLNQQSAATNYEAQGKCAKDAKEWFRETWRPNKDTIFLDYTNHYNIKLNKCFILVEHHYNSHVAGPGGDSWTNEMNIFDVYENSKYGEYTENHYTYYKPTIRTSEEVIVCAVTGKNCTTMDGFDSLIGSYMND